MAGLSSWVIFLPESATAEVTLGNEEEGFAGVPCGELGFCSALAPGKSDHRELRGLVSNLNVRSLLGAFPSVFEARVCAEQGELDCTRRLSGHVRTLGVEVSAGARPQRRHPGAHGDSLPFPFLCLSPIPDNLQENLPGVQVRLVQPAYLPVKAAHSVCRCCGLMQTLNRICGGSR